MAKRSFASSNVSISFTGELLMTIFMAAIWSTKLGFRTVRFICRTVMFLWNERNQSRGQASASHAQSVTNKVSEAVLCPALQADQFVISNRIHTADLVQAGKVYGQLWLYTYDLTGTVRRVMKISDSHLQGIMGSSRIDMGTVKYNPATGEAGIEAIKQSAFVDFRAQYRTRKPKFTALVGTPAVA